MREFFSLHTNQDSCDLVWPSGSGLVAIGGQEHGTHIRVSVNDDRICVQGNAADSTCEQGFGPFSRVPGVLKVNGDRFLVSDLKITPEVAPLPVCQITTSQVVHDGFIYRTLYGAAKMDGETNSNEEQTSEPMPSGYSIAPDDTYIASSVIAPYPWGVWRLCTEGACWGTSHYKSYDNTAGFQKDGEKKWETSNGEYRIKTGNHWYRLLIRAPCDDRD